LDSFIQVKIGELEVTNNPQAEFKTFVGSCVALCLYDLDNKVAGMAHVMLPREKPNHLPQKDMLAKFADKAITTLLSLMTEKGANRKKIKAKIAGGAKIFSHESESEIFNVGPENIKSIKTLLGYHDISIVSEDIGQSFGRWVRFSVGSGDMIIASSSRKTEMKI